jgi:hypothetical protein
MDEMRVRHCQAILKFGYHIGPLALVCQTLTGVTTNSMALYRRLLVVYAIFWLFYAMTYLTLRKKSLKAHHVNGIFTILAMMYFIRSLLYYDSVYYFVQTGIRACTRILMGLMVLDIKHSLWFNVVASCIACYKYYDNCAVFEANLAIPINQFGVFALEWLTTTVVVAVLYLSERWIEDCICAKHDMTAAKQAHCAVRKLLSVLCDAEVYLGPDLKIFEPSKKLCHMFFGSSDALAGRCFTCFVMEQDHQRFHDFLTMSAARISSGGEGNEFDDSGPPSSIQLQLQDENGRALPVELFHANLHDVNHQLGHLLGIRECCLLPTENRAAFCKTGDSSITPSVIDSVSSHHGYGASAENAADTSSQSSSRSSSSCFPSASDLQGTPLPELTGIRVEFDAFSDRFTVRELTLTFGADGQPPLFADGILENVWDDFRHWVQQEINADFSGECNESSCQFGPVLLRWPRAIGAAETLLLEASSASIECDTIGVSDSDEAEDCLPVTVNFEGFTQYCINTSRIRCKQLRRRKQDPAHTEHLSAIYEAKVPSSEALVDFTQCNAGLETGTQDAEPAHGCELKTCQQELPA